MTEKWNIILSFTVALLGDFLQRIHMLYVVIPQIRDFKFPCLVNYKILSLTREHVLLTSKRSESTAYWALKSLSLFCSCGFFSFCAFRARAVFHSSPFMGFRWHFGAGNIMCQKIAAASYCVSYCFLCQEVSEHKHFPIALIFQTGSHLLSHHWCTVYRLETLDTDSGGNF